jgi:hypothetical protein
MRKKIAIIFLTLFAAVAIHRTFFQVREIVPNVYDRPIGACVVEWYQVRGILVFACPRMDTIKLWPLPMEQLWFEDAIETNGQWINFVYRVE